MDRKQMIKTAADALMTIALLMLMAYELIGQTTHEIIGTVMLLLFVAHHILNRSWHKNLFRGRYSPYRVFQAALVAAIFLLMAGQGVSGVLLSRHLFTFLPVRGGAYWARSLHMLGAYWNFVLMSLHLGLHWSMALAPLQRAFRGKAVLLPVAGAVVVLFGVTAFLRREVGAYLLGQIQFTIFDFEEPLVLFFLDYLAMMGLFVWTGHYLGLLLRKLSRPRKGGQK
jgi:hypothetical protein